MTLIPMNIHLRISTKVRQINSPAQIQWLFIAPAGKGNMYWLAAQDKWKCYLWVASDTAVVGGTPRGVKRISVGTDVGSLPTCRGTPRSLG